MNRYQKLIYTTVTAFILVGCMLVSIVSSSSAQVNVTNFDNVRADGFVRVDRFLRLSPNTPIAVTQGMTITPRGSYQPLQAGSAVSTGAIMPGNAGDVLYLVNVSTGTITISDTGKLKLGGTRALGQFDSLTLISDGDNWIEQSFANN